jgi:MFS family permease
VGDQRPNRLWRNPAFLRLWAGQSISLFGSRVTIIALPLTAVYSLHADAVEMGILTATSSLAYLLIGLPAGAWVDRLPRRPIMVAADVGRAVLLASIPAASLLGLLRIGQLYVVGLLAGILTVLFDVAYQSLLPSLVPTDRLVEANSKLQVSESVAQVVGPGLGGSLVQLLTAPVAVAADALSFIISALSLAFIQTSEPAGSRREVRDLRGEMREGLATVVKDPSLRALAGAGATFNLFDNVLFAVYVLYMTRTLHFSGTAVGLVFGLGGIGGILGALIVARMTDRFGLGPVMLGGIIVAAAGELSIAGAHDPVISAVAILVAAETVVEFGTTLYRIDAVSLRQAAVPDYLQGRVNASMQVISGGLGPFGALVGGVLGEMIGLRATVLIAGIGTLFSFLWLVLSPVGLLRATPAASFD